MRTPSLDTSYKQIDCHSDNHWKQIINEQVHSKWGNRIKSTFWINENYSISNEKKYFIKMKSSLRMKSLRKDLLAGPYSWFYVYYPVDFWKAFGWKLRILK